MRSRMNMSVAIIAGFSLCACVSSSAFKSIESADVTVQVTELESGEWRVEYALGSPQKVMFFARSNGDYRVRTWTPENGAPQVERIGGFDALVAAEPTDRFSYVIQPYSDGIPRDYTPFLTFSDGGQAVYTGQFELLTAIDVGALEALNGDLGNWSGDQPRTGVRIVSDRPMLFQGQTVSGRVEHVSKGTGTYVYVGDNDLYVGDSYVGVIDNALPQHLRDSLDQDLSDLFAIYEDRWGFQLSDRGTVYYAFEGYTHPGFSSKGSVIGTDLMVLQSSGEGLRQPSQDMRTRNLWFFAHEGAHMFQSAVMEQFTVGPDAWIHEGGANTMGNMAIQSLPGVPDEFILGEYRTAFEQCLSDLEQGSLKTAHLDGRFYAHYNCGQIFNAAADSALSDHDLYEFWRAFTAEIDPQRSDPAAAFFTTLDELGADPDIGALIRSLAYEDNPDPRADLSRLMEMSGLAPEFDVKGGLIALVLPQ